MGKIAKPKNSNPRERSLETGEEEIILAKLAKDKRADRKDAIWLPYLFRFAINSGLRLGETSRIEPNEELINDGLVFLHQTKNENDRLVPLTKGAWYALLDFKPHWGKKTIFTLDEKSLSHQDFLKLRLHDR